MSKAWQALSDWVFRYAKAHAGGFAAAGSVLVTALINHKGHLDSTDLHAIEAAFGAGWIAVSVTANTIQGRVVGPKVISSDTAPASTPGVTL